MLRAMKVMLVVVLFLSPAANAGLILTLEDVSDSDHSLSLQNVLEPQESAQNSTSGYSSEILSDIEPAQLNLFFSSYSGSSSSFVGTSLSPELIQLILSLLYGECDNFNNNNHNATIPEPASGLFAVGGGAYLSLRNRRRKLSA